MVDHNTALGCVLQRGQLMCPPTLISTGARRLERSFLCTHRKLISTIATPSCRSAPLRAAILAGTAVMNPTCRMQQPQQHTPAETAAEF